KNEPTGLQGGDLIRRRRTRMDFGVDADLPHPPRDQLRVLTSKIQNNNSFVHLRCWLHDAGRTVKLRVRDTASGCRSESSIYHFAVIVGGKEVFDLVWIGQFHSNHPSLPVWVLVDEFRVRLQIFVHLDDPPTQGHEELGHRFHGFHGTKGVVLGDLRSDWLELDENDIAQLPLRKIGYAYDGDGIVGLQ